MNARTHFEEERPRAVAAFTVVELLAVIVIVGVLAAILIPLVASVRQSARQAACVGHLSQLGRAILLYVNDHRGALPAPEDSASQRWPIFIAPYIGSYVTGVHATNGKPSGLIGSDTGKLYAEPILHDPGQPGTGAAGIFGYNHRLQGTPVLLNNLTKPSSLPLLATSDRDAGGGLVLSPDYPSPLALDHGWTGGTTKSGAAPAYGGKAVFLFADWRVEAVDVCDPDEWPWNGMGAETDAFDPK